MSKHTNHGFKRDSKEYRRMLHLCKRYKISIAEYCANEHLYPMGSSSKYQVGTKDYRKAAYLKHMYGITLDQYDEMFHTQNGCCAICGIHQDELKKSLSIDHCHNSGIVRGLLCANCNHGLGKFMDSPDLIRKAALYIERVGSMEKKP